MSVLAVIPARGGSKGIIKKNIRLLNSKPLIYYSICTAIGSKSINDIVVTSDDDEILDYAGRFPICLRARPHELANDNVTLDPVVYDATVHMETKFNKKYSLVVTLQPTSPLLTSNTLDKAIAAFFKDGTIDTLIPVVDATHLYWREQNERVVPDYAERLNRQWLPKRYKEAGSFHITRRNYVTEKTRFGNKVQTYILTEVEGLDIDSPLDWIIAESLSNNLSIAFIVNGNRTVGMGHVYRTIALANRLIGRTIFFITFNNDDRASKIIIENGYAVIETNVNSLAKKILSLKPNIVINDILDTKLNYITQLKKGGMFVVNFEDLGEGTEQAHLIFNALYERTDPQLNQLFGYKYECINDKFLLYPTINFNPRAETLLITFGGVDQNNMTLKTNQVIHQIIKKTDLRNIISVVGLGYSQLDYLREFVDNSKLNVELYQNVDDMPSIMSHADLAVTSNGRTVYELAAMGVPSISIAQNDRETLHSFARFHRGVKYLGMASNLAQNTLANEIKRICVNTKLRKTMYLSQIKDAQLIRNGASKVVDEILVKYKVFRNENDKNW